MATISARGIKFIYNDHEEVMVFYKVGNCKLTDNDIETLLGLQEVCRENPTEEINCRK